MSKMSSHTHAEFLIQERRSAIYTFCDFLKKEKSLQEFENILGKGKSGSSTETLLESVSGHSDITSLYSILEDQAVVFHDSDPRWSGLNVLWKKIVEQSFRAGSGILKKDALSFLFNREVLMASRFSSYSSESSFGWEKAEDFQFLSVSFLDAGEKEGETTVPFSHIEDILKERLRSLGLIYKSWINLDGEFCGEVIVANSHSSKEYIVAKRCETCETKNSFVFRIIEKLLEKYPVPENAL